MSHEQCHNLSNRLNHEEHHPSDCGRKRLRRLFCVLRAPGCYSQGDTYEEAVANIKDAIRLHIEDRLADGEEIPKTSVTLSTVEIAV